MARLDDIIDQLKKNRSALESAKQLIRELVAKVGSCEGDRAQLDQVLAEIRAQADELAQAVLDGTEDNTPGPSQPGA